MKPRYFLYFFIFLLSPLLWAYPNIGDKVQWSGVLTPQQGPPLRIQISKEVIAFDKRENKWTIKYDASLGEHKTSKTLQVENLFSPEKFKKLMKECLTIGGHIENISTDVGTYETCKLTSTQDNGSTIESWWGNIPFGVIIKNTTAPQRNSAPDLDSVLAGL